MEKLKFNPNNAKYYSEEFIKGFECGVERQFNADVAEKKAEWISVSERLPEKMGTYLVTLEYKEHGIGVTTLWFHGAEIGWDLRVADIVIAWMPLPEPHKVE